MLAREFDAVRRVHFHSLGSHIVIGVGVVKVTVGPDIVLQLQQVEHILKTLVVTSPDRSLLLRRIRRVVITRIKARVKNVAGLYKVLVRVASHVHTLPVHHNIERGRQLRPAIAHLGDGSDVIKTQCLHIADIHIVMSSLGQTGKNIFVRYMLKTVGLNRDRAGEGHLGALCSLPDNRLSGLSGIRRSQFQGTAC